MQTIHCIDITKSLYSKAFLLHRKNNKTQTNKQKDKTNLKGTNKNQFLRLAVNIYAKPYRPSNKNYFYCLQIIKLLCG